MNRSIFRILFCFVLSATLIALLLLVINFFALAYTASDDINIYGQSPTRYLNEVSEHLTRTETGDFLLSDYSLPEELWCILLDASGQMVWEQHKPEDVPETYTLNDVAQMTRWFLQDYPVYVQTKGDGLLVLGLPKNAVGKYFIQYSMNWFHTLPQRLAAVFLLNALLAALLACLAGFMVYRRLRILMQGIRDLKLEKPVYLPVRGIFREVLRSINETSDAIGRKNQALRRRDDARRNWIAGISHDIRTPLAVILGNAEELAETPALPQESREKAEMISAQSIKIKKLVEDLNLISSLEYDMQPARKKEISVCALLRSVVSDLYNSGVLEGCSLNVDLRQEKAVILGDERLLARAFFNIIQNAAVHNQKPCSILIEETADRQGGCWVRISDNGSGVPEEVLKRIDSIPKTPHGLGLPMAAKIIAVHGGRLNARNEHGLCVEIYLPTV